MRILKATLFLGTIFSMMSLGGVAAEAVVEPVETTSNCFEHRHSERGFLHKINNTRANARKPFLRLDRELSKVARRHTWEMTTKNLLHHTSAIDFRRRVTNWQYLGENVGVGGTVDSLHAAFMNSPGHRANILDGGYRHVGIGTQRARGKLWVTVVFEERTNPGTTLPMPVC